MQQERSAGPAARRLRALARASAIPVVVPVAILLGACSSHRATFPDAPPEQVWTAMKAAAVEPSYPDWIVLENAVVVDETDRTIEIYRQLRRDVVSPGVKPHREDQEWKLSISLRSPPPPKPSEVVFTSRDASMPMTAEREAERYFEDVRELLRLPGGTRSGSPGASATQAPPPSPSVGEPAPPGQGAAADPARPSAPPASPPPPPVDLPQ